MKKSTRFILIILSLLLTVGCGYLYITIQKKISARGETYAEIANKISELKKEKAELEKELPENADDEYQEDLQNLPKVIMCFRNVSESVFEEVYPTLSQKRLTGVMVSLAGILPEDGDKLSNDNVKTMVDDGWGYALGCGNAISFGDSDSANRKELKNYMEDYIDDFEDATDCDVKAIYFTSNTYDSAFNETIKQLGISVVFYEGSFVKSKDDDLVLVHIQDNPSNDDILNTSLNGQITGYRIDMVADNTTGTYNYYSKTNMNSYLTRFANGKSDGLFRAVKFSELLNGNDKSSEEIKEESEADVTAIRERIAEIEAEIQALYLSDRVEETESEEALTSEEAAGEETTDEASSGENESEASTSEETGTQASDN